jgi:hypothetical protein
MTNLARILTLLYAVVVGLAALWAWYADVTLLHSGREHILPDILLAIVSLPTSNTLDFFYERSPAFFAAPLAQLTSLTACGASGSIALSRRRVRTKGTRCSLTSRFQGGRLRRA